MDKIANALGIAQHCQDQREKREYMDDGRIMHDACLPGFHHGTNPGHHNKRFSPENEFISL